ncbi:Hypothetical predicted protein [Mytilus galloprovincialis]|uniref:Uncharacterized protein n=1 Tax=Mytilus galloprovincialis TaxID=29158 RepID=A0A8B6CUI7_MYTGA|nr:Hypothetical predicted protein [Mytilus galloprovincialis]
MMLRDTEDDKVKEANVDVRTLRKWVAKSAVEDAENILRHRDLVGVVTSGRLGFDNIQQPLWQSADASHRRKHGRSLVGKLGDRRRKLLVGMEEEGRAVKELPVCFWLSLINLEIVGDSAETVEETLPEMKGH